MKQIQSYAAIILLLIVLLTLVSCSQDGERGEYTYRSFTTALGSNWNPHSWENTADREIMELITTPLVSVLPLNTSLGSYQFSFDHARSVRDVTSSCKSDLLKYGSDVGDGIDGIESGYVYEIELREGLAFDDGRAINSDTFIESMKLLLNPEMKNSRANLYISGEAALAGADKYFSGTSDFDSVGIYKVSDTVFRYVTLSYIDYNYFLSSLSSSWLVHPEIYKRGISGAGLKSTDYNTKPDTTASSGPYKILSYQAEKEVVFIRNEVWYGWQKSDTGATVSYTDCYIDGEMQQQYASTRIVMSVMDEVTAKQSFLRGELSVYTPGADEYPVYRHSDKLYSMSESYTMSLFFNTDLEMLGQMDRTRGNKYSVVLSDTDFRRGMSYAIDRAELSYSSGGYVPEFTLLNSLYHYDIYNDPDSVYRDSEDAMRAICRLYSTDYGQGTPYPTLREAYLSISGYNREAAAEAFRSACDRLVAEGVYERGEPIRIRVAWAKGALTSDDNKLVSLINGYINLAALGSGFGRITLEPIGQVSNRYRAVPEGEFAIGYGAWGGASFYPFRAFRVYFDPEYQNLHEDACWSPETEELTLTVDGDDVTMTYQEWSRSMTGVGRYARSDETTKLEITAKLEEAFLSKYYRIPLLQSTSHSLLSHRIEYFTHDYNVMYGFGGFRLMRYLYDDYEWSVYIKRVGKLTYG